jgi:hypothetical protein
MSICMVVIKKKITLPNCYQNHHSLFTSQSCKHLSLGAKRPVLCTQCSLCLYRSEEISDLERDWNERDGRKAKEVSDVNIYIYVKD